MTALHASSAVLPPLSQLQFGVGESFGFGAAGAAPQDSSHLRHAGAKGGAPAADGQKAGADGQPALRRGSDDSSRELVTSVPQLGTFVAALAGKRLASQRSMHSLDDLSWARRPSGQDGSTMEASSIGTFTRGLERIANQMPTPTHDPEEKDEYLMRLLGGPRSSTAAASCALAATGSAAAPQQLAATPHPATNAVSNSRLLSNSSALHSTPAPDASASQQPAASAKAAGSNAASRDSPAARLAAHLAGPQAFHPVPAKHPGAAALAAACSSAAPAASADAQTKQQFGLVAYRKARAVLLAQQGEFNSQLYAMHAAARRQRQLLAACEEPELYQMALARVCAAAPPDAAKALSFAAALPFKAAAAATAAAQNGDPARQEASQQLQTQASAAPQRQQEVKAEQQQQQQMQPVPSMQSQQLLLQSQPSCMQSQHLQQQQHMLVMQQQHQQQQALSAQQQALSAQQHAFSAAQQQAAAAQSMPGMYGPAASFDPMSAWYATQLGGPGGQQQPFFGSAPPQLAMQQAALAQQQAFMQQQLAACQLQQQQLMCGAMQAPGGGMQQPGLQQAQLSVLYGQASGLPGMMPPGADLAPGGIGNGCAAAANGAASQEPAKWWQDTQATFGPAALPPGINSANAFHSGQRARGSAAEPQSAPPQPKTTPTRPVRAAAAGGKRAVPASVAVPPKKRARSTSTPSSREEHIGQNSDPDRNNSASPQGVAAGAQRTSPPATKTKRQHGLKRGAAAGRKRADESISSGCSKAGIDGADNLDLNTESAAPPAALESAAGILLSFSGCA